MSASDVVDSGPTSRGNNTAPRPSKLPPPPSDLSSDDSQSGNQQHNIPLFRQRMRNAHSKSITTAPTIDTHGALNQHPAEYGDFSVGVQDAQGARMSMEDAYSFVVDFAGVRGQGFFAIFDGHAGPEAAEWCGAHFHEQLLADLKSSPSSMPISEVLNKTFLSVDAQLSGMSSERGSTSGCTAVTAFLRLEDAGGAQPFVKQPSQLPLSASVDSSMASLSESSSFSGGSFTSTAPPPSETLTPLSSVSPNSKKQLIKSAVRTLASSVSSRSRPSSPSPSPSSNHTPRSSSPPPSIVETSSLGGLNRVLYTANAGDARAVLCRAGKAVRLTYDHKGADRQEAKRIQDAGGFVLNNRVNGVLAVTRSLGDSSMKEFVVGSPYTTETALGPDDEFLILACDGLWDVASDQEAVDLVRDVNDSNIAAKKLMEHALDEGTRDNVTILIVRFNKLS